MSNQHSPQKSEERRWTLIGRVLGPPGNETPTVEVLTGMDGPLLPQHQKVAVMPVSEHRAALQDREVELEQCAAAQVELGSTGVHAAGHELRETHSIEPVTAIDARDIEPLVEAARRGLEDLEDVHAPSVGPLQAALAPFDSEEEK